MKKLHLAVALAVATLSTIPAFAASATADVPVVINLTPVCQITTPGNLTFTYVSFQTGISTGVGGAFTIRCTTSLPYKVGFDATAAPLTKTVAASAANLQLGYGLGLSGTTTGSGTGLTAIALSVTGTMAAGQSGTCATGAGCTATENNAVYVVY